MTMLCSGATKCTIPLTVLVSALLMGYWRHHYNLKLSEICSTNAIDGQRYCRPTCQHGYYSLPGMNFCKPWLTCTEIKKLNVDHLIAKANVKMVQHAVYNGYRIVHNSLLNPDYLEDFMHGMAMLEGLNPNPHVTQMIGFCNNTSDDRSGKFHKHEKPDKRIHKLEREAQKKRKYLKNITSHHNDTNRDDGATYVSTVSKVSERPVYVTEYHELGNAGNFEQLLNNNHAIGIPYDFTAFNTIDMRFSMCIKYVDILVYLHASPMGTRVMCDSNDLVKTLSQFLITNDFGLILNDLDATPEVIDDPYTGIKCGPRELFGEFVAPEQLWKQPGKFHDSRMNTYDEQVDIWRIPDICGYFLGISGRSHSIGFHLFNIHKQCKELEPNRRPSAREVLREYQRIWNMFGFK